MWTLVITVMLIGVFAFFAFFVVGLNIQEITTDEYTQVQNMIKEYPQLNPTVNKALEDNRISQYEFRKIEQMVNEIKKKQLIQATRE